jgi:hypothetical protein
MIWQYTGGLKYGRVKVVECVPDPSPAPAFSFKESPLHAQ